MIISGSINDYFRELLLIKHNHRVTKQALFVIEVDGVTFHEQNPKQRARDELKDRALDANKIPVHRFKTNESEEVMRLRGILKEYG